MSPDAHFARDPKANPRGRGPGLLLWICPLGGTPAASGRSAALAGHLPPAGHFPDFRQLPTPRPYHSHVHTRVRTYTHAVTRTHTLAAWALPGLQAQRPSSWPRVTPASWQQCGSSGMERRGTCQAQGLGDSSAAPGSLSQDFTAEARPPGGTSLSLE